MSYEKKVKTEPRKPGRRPLPPELKTEYERATLSLRPDQKHKLIALAEALNIKGLGTFKSSRGWGFGGRAKPAPQTPPRWEVWRGRRPLQTSQRDDLKFPSP